MITVIKHSSKLFKATCSRCGCVFTYELSDLLGGDTIQCPDCKRLVNHTTNTEINIPDSNTGTGTQPNGILPDDFIRFPHGLEKLNISYNQIEPRSCEDCSFYQQMLKSGDTIYVGDTPCTWCVKNNPTVCTVKRPIGTKEVYDV